jgi:hypothetical protein
VTSNEVGIAEQRAQQPGYRLGGITGKGFRPGQSGNPKGRRPGPEPPPPAISPRTLRELARGYTRECVETLAAIMQTAPRTADRIEAASILLSRGWGLPTQPISAEGEVLIAVSEITKASDTLTAKLTTLAASVSRDDGPAPPRPALPAGHPTFAEKRAWLFGEVSDNGDAPSGSGAKGGGSCPRPHPGSPSLRLLPPGHLEGSGREGDRGPERAAVHGTTLVTSARTTLRL